EDMFVFRGDAEVQKYNDDPFRNVGEARAFIRRLRDDYAAQNSVAWGITLRGHDRMIGLCGFRDWDRRHNRAEIGYDLAKLYWRQGIGSEAVGVMLRFGFTRMNLNRVEAEAVLDNVGSVRLLEKQGFQREGVRREFTLETDGKYLDDGVFGLLRSEYFK
ncbi:MAG: GNAT family N-acetyltransferase, partial [Chloroflexota bacterium]